jgi:hypothetical protein
MFARMWLGCAISFVALVALIGCSGGKGSGTFATVSGKVTQDGGPADGVKVTFHSTTEVEGKGAGSFSATTDSSGKYLIATVGKDPGIPPGLYRVTITKIDPRGVPLGPEMDQAQLEAAGTAINMMPKEYENPRTTKLSATVQAGKNENVDFDIKGGKASGGVLTKAP